jgi:YHS domain-containing protein
VVILHVQRKEKRKKRRGLVAIRKQEVIAMARDQVCGMEVKEDSAGAALEHKGQMFYFCSLSCYDAFEKHPERYVSDRKEGWWARFLNRLAQANRETYGGKAPKCH